MGFKYIGRGSWVYVITFHIMRPIVEANEVLDKWLACAMERRGFAWNTCILLHLDDDIIMCDDAACVWCGWVFLVGLFRDPD